MSKHSILRPNFCPVGERGGGAQLVGMARKISLLAMAIMVGAILVPSWAVAQNYVSGTTISLNSNYAGYSSTIGDASIFTLPKGMRVIVVGQVDGGYVVDTVPEWKDQKGAVKAGTITLVEDGINKAFPRPKKRFVVYPNVGESRVNADLVSANSELGRTLQKSLGTDFSEVGEGYLPDEEEPMGDSAAGAPKKSAHTVADGREATFKSAKQTKLLKSGAVLRSEPSQNGHLVASLGKGARVEALGEQGAWTKIKNGKDVAWIATEMLEGAIPKETKVASTSPAPKALPAVVTGENGCLKFDPGNYTLAKVKAFIKRQKSLENKDIKGLKESFMNFFGPLSLHLSNISGYPASVMMSQWSEETGWGAGGTFGKGETLNIAGVSCFDERESFVSREAKFSKSGKSVNISTNCGTLRPGVEGDMYKGYKNLIEAGYDYVHNLVDNPNMAKPYEKVREVVKNMNLSSREKADQVISAIAKGGYATNAHYKKNLLSIMSTNGYWKYDQKELCK